MDHFANAFTLTPGRCFRMVALPGVGHPSHCSEPVAWHGRWRAADDRLYRMDACEGQAERLVAPLRLGDRMRGKLEPTMRCLPSL
jgi:hypothetical protein